MGNAVASNGVAGLPIIGGTVSNVVQGIDTHTNSFSQVQVVGLPGVGATTPGGNQAIGVSALSRTASTGSVATVGALNHGAQQVANVSIGGTQVLGTSNSAAITVGVLNGAEPNNCNCNNKRNPVTNVAGTVSNTVNTVTTAVGTILGHP